MWCSMVFDWAQLQNEGHNQFFDESAVDDVMADSVLTV